MSRILPLPFQQEHIEALQARFEAVRLQYEQLGAQASLAEHTALRRNSACVLLQAPTGSGKTLMACELMARFSIQDNVLWFWFAPFAGIIDQARRALKRQAPAVTQLDIEADRRPERIEPGAVFVLTWQTVAARSRDARVARTSGDAGLAIDDLVHIARDKGLRIAVVVDEAHHGFVRATEACKFFGNTLAPDYVLLMTATPRDQDTARFAQATGYRIGGPTEWASVTRAEGVAAGLLKRSVKAARFLVKNPDDATLLSFEEVALAECAAMHRHLKAQLAACDIGLVPLMLVQVPNGAAALQQAQAYLVDTLGFAAHAVRAHTADEPDPNLEALAADPQVEVILFKMAIATGFDAPRAFTLAALRGARDVNFGVQVVGRIMRVHRLLQGRAAELPAELSLGYVFLANSEAQEGLIGAAGEINQMPEHLASAGTSTVVTVLAGESVVQVARPGEPLQLFPVRTPDAPPDKPGEGPASALPEYARAFHDQSSLFEGAGALSEFGEQPGLQGTSFLAQAFALEARAAPRRYLRKAEAPETLVTETLPQVPEDFEERLVALVDFRPVLGDRMRVRSRIIERSTDIFDASDVHDRDLWARVSPAAIAQKARQLAFDFEDVDRRAFLRALKRRFAQALQDEGHETPESDEALTRQLELVLVRNPGLIRQAYKRLQSEQMRTRCVQLSEALESDWALEPAARNVYGVFPPDLSPSERVFAEQLDTAQEVLWWHRNPVRKPQSVALYGWAKGVGFFPDFVVGVDGRKEGDGVALAELKGAQLLHYDREKAGAQHPVYGRVYLVGRSSETSGLRLWRLAGTELVDDGPFEPQRMRYS